MDGDSKKLIEDCFLRPIADPRSTKPSAEPAPSKVTLKTELQLLRLSEDAQNMVMGTLRSIHGSSFKLEEASKYKDRGGHLKKSYWKETGTLMIQGVSDFSNTQRSENTPEDRFRRFAVMKLESYGFPRIHCEEALDHCEGSVEMALHLLADKYVPKGRSEAAETVDFSDADLLQMREDEKLALESIYDKAFEEKEKNAVWSLKFKVEHLLAHSPSQKKKAEVAKQAEMRKLHEKKVERCRNFARGHCKFGNRCRFSHEVVEKDDSGKASKAESELDANWFYLEIRFPQGTKYPFEAPFIFLKTTCHDIPREILLRLTRKLTREARQLALDGMPSIYTISDFLHMEDKISEFLANDREEFLDPTRSLFYVPENCAASSEKGSLDLPTHYQKGSTGTSETTRSPEEVQREDRRLVKKFLEKQSNPNYRNMLKARQGLPAWNQMTEILETVSQSQVVVISGETGCGKSTQVPQFLLDEWLYRCSKQENRDPLPHVEIICTQPRRLSAIGVAERIADERNERIGNSIGYQIRLENKISLATRLTFCTTGILLRRLHSDPLLRSVSHVIVDEVHERSEESDFLLLILKEILHKRKDLKVILMSATLNANLFSEYFGGVPVLEIPGRTFPVEQLFLEDIIESSGFVLEPDSQFCRKLKKSEEEALLSELEYADVKAANEAPPRTIRDENLNMSAMFARYADYSKRTCKSLFLMDPMKINPELIEAVLRYIVEGDHHWPKEGAIVIFLPGLAEIQSIHDALNDSQIFGPRAGKFLLVPLHSTLTNEEQALVFRKPPPGQRKIVLSTNIAETSVTIDDCVFVIDCGQMKEKRFDANRNMESLELVWESRANALQRKGRAGRVMPGVCIHLFTGHRFHNHLLSQPIPEIHRVPLEQLLLRVKTLPNFSDENILNVVGKTLEPPTEENIVSAVKRLQDVGAFDEEQNLTALGHHLSALPVDVRIGKLMLFGCIFQCLDSVLTIAACLSHKSPFVCPFNKRNEADRKKKEFAICNSDHLTVLKAYKRWLEAVKKSRYAGKCYAEENFLSSKTLETIIELKYQFLELLISIGFVPTDMPRKKKNLEDNISAITGFQLNCNGENNRLLTAILCAALYPNIVKVLTPEKSYTMTAGGAMPHIPSPSDLRFKTREDGFVALHPSSVNSVVGHFTSPFLVFQEKVKTSRIFIRECSMVPLLPLVFFAGSDLQLELHGGDFIILLEDGWIMLKAHNHETAEMILCLRRELIKLLEEKIRDPCLNLLNHETGKKIIGTIVNLISKE